EINSYGTTAAAGDMDGDGMIEAMISGSDLLIKSLPNDPATVDLRFTDHDPLGLNSGLTHAAMADVDGDGRLDAVVCGENSMRVLNYSLSSVDAYPVPYPVRYALSADLGSGHGHAVFGVGENMIWQFTTGARQADGFPIPLPENADVVLFPSRDGKLAIAAASPEGTVFVYGTGNAITPEQLLWRSRNCDERNAFSVTRPFAASAPIAEYFPPNRCYNWPNPVYDNTTFFRLYVSEASSVTVKIYDLAGDKVDEISANAAGGTDTDIPWNVSDIQSDTYLAHVKVTAGGKTGEKIIKVAVVK
ncbi:MAG: T9SS type A sorting domain-containing protein, partial [Bacteroidetes bacterium]|nr:T9SS type A sorting domain-containing protein [Bacteroidota bacterium]